MNEEFSRFDTADYLRDNEDMRLYLEACLAEDPGDGSLIRAALGSIARARGISELAREAGVSRMGLYKALSEKGNPSFALVVKVARSLGLRLSFTPEDARAA